MAQTSIQFRSRKPTPENAPSLGASTKLQVSGMDCASCAQHVTQALTGVTGVTSANVDLAAGQATVRWQSGSNPQPDALVAAVAQAGYSARPETTASGAQLEFRIDGMTCQNCAQHVQSALQGVAGVVSAVVDLGLARATVRLGAAGSPTSAELVAAVQAAGYGATLQSATSTLAPARETDTSWRTAVWLGAPVTLALMIAEWGFGLGMNRTYHWIAFALTLPVQAIIGAKFYRGAWRQLRVGRSNMDTLVSLGSTAAFGFSVGALLTHFPGHLYFMEAAGILTLISVGHWLEARMSAQAGASLKALLQLAPARARKLDGTQERDAAVAELRAGDSIILKPGDRVPVDGEVVEGASAVDEAMLTGEAVAVEKSLGAKLYTGTINQSGRLVVRVTATGEATALAHIIAAVERAQSSRADIQRLADRVSSVFVPIVVGVAIVTAVWWGWAYSAATATHAALAGRLWSAPVPESPIAAAFVMFAAVLIVACPCAMGLATPTALMAGVNAAARRGILIRDAQALEKSGRVTTVIFDKTGTMTLGTPTVAEYWVAGESDEAARTQFLRGAAALAGGSQHPLSRAIAAQVPASENPEAAVGWADWREVRGSGIEARRRVDGRREELWQMGSAGWLKTEGIEVSTAATFAERWTAQGATVLYLAQDRQLRGTLALRDSLKPGALELVKTLRTKGLKVGLLTGDQRATALAIGAELGIEPVDIAAEVRPEQKAEAIRTFQSRGERVAFVGDGLNDGPALAQADLGIAVARATDVAKEAADIVLLRSDLLAIPAALGLAQATLRVIHQNLFWAFFYNAAFVPLAALGFLSPMLSAVAMALSDVIVIGNALRLRRR